MISLADLFWKIRPRAGGEAVDHAVEVARPLAGQLQGDGDGFADEVGRVHILALGDQVEREMEQPRDRLLPREALEQEGVRAEGGGDGERAVRLRVCRHGWPRDSRGAGARDAGGRENGVLLVV
jgi:hypothetical protein